MRDTGVPATATHCLVTGRRLVVIPEGEQALCDYHNCRREVWIRVGKRCVKCGILVSLETMEMDHRQGGRSGGSVP